MNASNENNSECYLRDLPEDVLAEIGETGGVWVGRYRVIDAQTLELKREFKSRQTSRRVGDLWEERIEYLYTDEPPVEKVFQARMGPGGSHIYDRTQIVSGRSEKTSQGQVVFPYVWANGDEGIEVLEVQNYLTGTLRTRVWQRVRDKKLYELVIVEEEKIARQDGDDGGEMNV